jgi:serine/threonine protein kinase
VLISVLNGLRRLHRKKILHRDLKVITLFIIKSANIFITEKGIVKIGDLNVSKVSQEGLCFTQTGTPYYASP